MRIYKVLRVEESVYPNDEDMDVLSVDIRIDDEGMVVIEPEGFELRLIFSIDEIEKIMKFIKACRHEEGFDFEEDKPGEMVVDAQYNSNL